MRVQVGTAAPRGAVWKAFTEPERPRRWRGPKGFTVERCTVDLRPGGAFHYGLRSPDGAPMWGRFVYRETEAPRRAVHVVSFSDEKGGATRHPMHLRVGLDAIDAAPPRMVEQLADPFDMLLAGEDHVGEHGRAGAPGHDVEPLHPAAGSSAWQRYALALTANTESWSFIQYPAMPGAPGSRVEPPAGRKRERTRAAAPGAGVVEENFEPPTQAGRALRP